MQDLSIHSGVHQLHQRGQNTSAVAYPKITEPRLGLGWALPSVVRAKVRAFKTVLNIEVAPDSSRQHPKKIAHDSEDIWRGLPCEPGSHRSLPLNGGQHGLLEHARHRRACSGMSRCSFGFCASGFPVEAQARMNFVL